MNIKKKGGGRGEQQNQTAEPKADKCAICHFSLSNCCLTVVLRLLCFVVINSILLTFKKFRSKINEVISYCNIYYIYSV